MIARASVTDSGHVEILVQGETDTAAVVRPETAREIATQILQAAQRAEEL
jgi:hypothetical protein